MRRWIKARAKTQPTLRSTQKCPLAHRGWPQTCRPWKISDSTASVNSAKSVKLWTAVCKSKSVKRISRNSEKSILSIRVLTWRKCDFSKSSTSRSRSASSWDHWRQRRRITLCWLVYHQLSKIDSTSTTRKETSERWSSPWWHHPRLDSSRREPMAMLAPKYPTRRDRPAWSRNRSSRRSALLIQRAPSPKEMAPRCRTSKIKASSAARIRSTPLEGWMLIWCAV